MHTKFENPDPPARWEYGPGTPPSDTRLAWYRVELVGGPLHGEVSCLSHTSHRLWVALLENGAHVVLRSLARPDTLPGAGTLIGDYSFDPAHEAMRWVANPPDVEIASAK